MVFNVLRKNSAKSFYNCDFKQRNEDAAPRRAALDVLQIDTRETC
jgi:hypothetical protein